MASVFVLLEAFTRKEAAALGFFPCATASFIVDKAICLNDSIIPYNPFAVLLPDHISRFSCHQGNMPVRQSQKVPR